MAALSARDAFRYGARLLGYLFVTTVVGGAILAAGVGLTVRLEPEIIPGGEAPDSYAIVAIGGAVSLLGLLVLLAGWLAILFLLISDAVRIGIDTAGMDPATSEPDDAMQSATQAGESASEPDPDEAQPEPAGSDPLAGGSDPFADRSETYDEPDTADPLSDPGSGGGPPQGHSGEADTPRQAGPAPEDDDAWRREIEAKLDEQEQPRGGRPE